MRDWEDERPVERKGRRKAAGRAAARSIVEQVRWCEWPLVWRGEGKVLGDGALEMKLAGRGAGVYAVEMVWGKVDLSKRQLEEVLIGIRPRVVELRAVNEELLAGVMGQVLRGDHYAKSLGKTVGDLRDWKGRIEAALKRARMALDSDGGAETEGLCFWVGGGRPSAGVLRADESNPLGAVILGRQRSVRRAAQADWQRCGRALGAWDVDAVVAAGRNVGAGMLAEMAEAMPELGESGAVVREMILCGVTDLKGALKAMPQLMEMAGRIERTKEKLPGPVLPLLVRMGLWRLSEEELLGAAVWAEAWCARGLGRVALWGLVEIAGAMDSANRARGIAAVERMAESLASREEAKELEVRAMVNSVLAAGMAGVSWRMIELSATELADVCRQIGAADGQGVEAFLRWVERGLDRDVDRKMLHGNSAWMCAQVFACLDDSLAARFLAFAEEVADPAERIKLLRWFVEFALDEEERRRFARRFLRELLDRTRRLNLGAVGLQRWMRCMEVARKWYELGWEDCRGVFARFMEECEKRPKWEPFSEYGSELPLLKMADGNVERALGLASARCELDWEQREQMMGAWKNLEGEICEFVGRLAADERLSPRVLRWLARAGFCARLRREGWGLKAAKFGPLERVGVLEVPEDCRAMMGELVGYLGADRLPARVIEALWRERRLRQELSALETMEHLPPTAWRRVENIRKWLKDPAGLREWVMRDLSAALQEAVDEARLADLERQAQSVVDEHLRKVVGSVAPAITDRRDWDNAVRLYYSTEKNRKILRKLMIREAAGNRNWMREHPGNRRFLDTAAQAGVDVEAWLGSHAYTVPSPAGRWHMAVELDPLAVLQMGNHFNTCLSERGVNSFATIANAVELNKRVIYVRDDRGVVVGRKLLAMTPAGEIVGFRSYGVGNFDPWGEGGSPWMKIALDSFCAHLAERCGARLHGLAGEVEGLELFAKWYNDGPEPFDGTWLKWRPGELWEGARSRGETFGCILEQMFGREDMARAQGMRMVLWLGEEGMELVRTYDEPWRRLEAGVKPEHREAMLSSIARHAMAPGLRELAAELLRR